MPAQLVCSDVELGKIYFDQIAIRAGFIAIWKRCQTTKRLILGFGFEEYEYKNQSLVIRLKVKNRWGSRGPATVVVLVDGQTVFEASGKYNILSPETKVLKCVQGPWILEVLTIDIIGQAKTA
jgi:hypothetical protein